MSDEMLVELIDTVMDDTGRPFTTAPELAERANVSRQGVHERLQDLVESGEIKKYKPGRAAVYWCED